MKRAYVTMLCGGDSYAPGVEALGRSLRASGTREPMIAMAAADVSTSARSALAAQGWQVRDIDALPSPARGTALFPRFDNVFSKLRAWQLTDIEKVVLLDADTLVLRNVDDLFERPSIAAAPDFLMPDRFNSGVMVLEPSAETFGRMLEALHGAESYDGGDQGFLNTFFGNWYAMPVEHRLPVGYNLFHFIFQFVHGHPALRRTLLHEARIVHYAVQKPWRGLPQLTGASAPWWSMYYDAHPEQDSVLRRRIHELEDWTFERVVDVFIR
ncbi:MAG: glycosyltransferase family 8 protein [Polyangiaceae bacterium]